jgi:hypothetical protein
MTVGAVAAAVVAAAASVAAAGAPVLPTCAAGRHVVLARPPAGSAYAAAFPFFSNDVRNEDYVTAARLDAYEQLAGKRAAWAYFSNHWTGGRIVFPRAAVELVWQHGALPFVRMMPWSRQQEGMLDPVFRMRDLARGRWDRQLRAWADAARATRIPIMVDFGPEMNGSWFPWNGAWSGGLAGAHAYRDAYRHIVRLVRARGADNVSFAFHIDADGDPATAWNGVRNYYPGDTYVDWVGASVYGAVDIHDDPEAFAPKLARAYRTLSQIAPGKPFAVFEWGIVDAPAKGDKPQWIRDAFAALRSPAFARVAGISWWDERWQESDGHWDDDRIDSDPAALAAYRAGIAGTRYLEAPRFACS